MSRNYMMKAGKSALGVYYIYILIIYVVIFHIYLELFNVFHACAKRGMHAFGPRTTLGALSTSSSCRDRINSWGSNFNNQQTW